MIHYYPCPGEDNVQAMIDADYQMAQQMQAEEQEKLSIEEKSKLYKNNQLKNKSFDDIQKLFDKAMKREDASKQERKIDDIDKETTELQRLIEVVPDKDENLETLYKLVKAKYGSTRPMEDLDLVLYGNLKTMFDPHVED
ncbi:hypothetical protein Tco_0390763 [Tanacetum coccineum]